MEHHKLVRDRIPEIIADSGKTPVTRVLAQDEYRRCLRAKLDEEVAEYHASGELEELADVLEVVCALCEADGHSLEELTKAYRAKHEVRGGFRKRIFLIRTE